MAIRLGQLLRVVRNADLIITPDLNRYLLKTPELVLTEAVGRRVHDLLTTQPRYRPGSFSSSASGSCYRKQEFDYLGMPSGDSIDPQLQMIFFDGTWRHLRWQATLLEAGLLSEVEVPLSWPKQRSEGTVDGIGVVKDSHPKEAWRGKEFGLELKGANSFVYRRLQNEGPVRYLNQVHRYFLSGGFDLFVIIVENKDTQEWSEWVIEPDPVRLDAQRAELAALNKAVDTKTLDSMLPECRMQTGPTFRQCPYGGKRGVCVRTKAWPRQSLAMKQAVAS